MEFNRHYNYYSLYKSPCSSGEYQIQGFEYALGAAWQRLLQGLELGVALQHGGTTKHDVADNATTMWSHIRGIH
eukprot:4524395-Lingulodinium_polyedra.AAC.1